jgi:hypothetical protein
MNTRGFFPRSDICSAHCGHSAGCRISWVHLQHHATVETFNGVKLCGSKFLPNVSKLCQIQHSAGPSKHARNVKFQKSQLSRYPRCCFLSPTSWQPVFTATAVSFLVSLQACQYKTTIFSHNLQCVQCGHFLLTTQSPAHSVQLSTYSSTV